MCGIAGAFGEHVGVAASVDTAVRRMTAAQAHRGPDDDGFLRRDDVVLGHRRLSIIDLSTCGHQPLSNETGSVWVCFNGEVYNHRELRLELERRGHHFASTSDTEVLVHGYEEWGIDQLLRRLRGMFAFALYDAGQADGPPAGGRRGELFLARDRFGIKPLYFRPGHRDVPLVFASEVRSLAGSGIVERQAEPRALLGFLLFGSVAAPLTTVRDVRALPPGHYLHAGHASSRVVEYYGAGSPFGSAVGVGGARDHRPRVGRRESADAAFRERMRGVLSTAVGSHLLSDAPLGVFLSGGIDSSALVALAAGHAQRLETVGIVFSEAQFSEERYQRAVVERFGTEHQRVVVTSEEARSEVERFFAAMDQPTIDGLNTYFVARAARQVGLKAVLSGIGGDEVFAGYQTVRRAATLQRLHSAPAPLRRALIAVAGLKASWRKLSFLRRDGVLARYLALRGLFTPREVAGLVGVTEAEVWDFIASLEPDHAPATPELAQQLLESRHYLVDQLLRDADVFGMAHSVEIRVPFLDHVVVETALAAPAAWRFDSRYPKPLLSRTLEDLLPHAVVFRRKRGFTFPLGVWLRSWGGPEVGGDVFDRGAVARAWGEFRAGRTHWSRPWTLLVLAHGGSAW